uniref:Uncharacterized protein n=1 Tax=Picea sitchensis TaxID=3332 RepID=A9NMT5_PICSI|nr:unknown [Picea sitchensis]
MSPLGKIQFVPFQFLITCKRTTQFCLRKNLLNFQPQTFWNSYLVCLLGICLFLKT